MLHRTKYCCLASTATSLICLLAVVVQSGLGDEHLTEGDRAGAALVIMAPGSPVFCRLHIHVDEQPYRLWVTQYLTRKLDANHDAALTIDELSGIPQRLLQQIELPTPQKLLDAATGKKGTKSIKTDLFNSWFSDRLSRSFNIIAEAVRASQAVRLASLIDRNGDGGVSEEELQQSSRVLRFRDLDDDQTYSAAELMPFRDPRNQQAAVVPEAADLPFVQLTDDAAVVRTCGQLLKRYGDGKTIPVSLLRLSNSNNDAVDVNGDQRVDEQECLSLLRKPPVQISLKVQLSDRSNASKVVFEVSENASQFCSMTQERRGRAKLTIDEMPIEIRARGGGSNTRTFFTSFLLQRMSLFDADKNDYLSEEEFPAMQQQMASQQIVATFEDVDLNDDQMLIRDEIRSFIERDTIGTQSRIDVSVKQDGKTLFSLLDQNPDRRLTARELQEGFQVLAEFDVNNDGTLMESELGTAYVLEIGLGQSDVLRRDSMQNMGMMAGSTDAVLPGVAGLSGPEWFRRMDRNQDRDVSFREFLGPRNIFDSLDMDQDGLLSATEAEQLTASE